MQVNGVGQSNSHAAKGIARSQAATRGSANTDPKPASSQVTTGDDAKVKGVIRLLQEGHFKGVADVRLRINFFDELQAIEHASLAEAANTDVSGLLEAVNAKVAELLDSGELTEEQATSVGEARNTFVGAVQQAVDSFQTEEGTNTQPLLDAINAAFEEFASSLESILAPPENVETVDESVAPELVPVDEINSTSLAVTEELETPPVEESILETFIAELRSIFDDAVGQLNIGLASATTLPPLSEPSGNGAAYAKFLEIYNGLLGNSSEPIGDAETSIDTQV